MVADARGARRRLEGAVEDASIRDVCQDFAVDLLAMFGSAVSDPDTAQDLDIAVRFTRYDAGQVLILLDRLAEIADSDALDLVVLNTAGPVIKERALLRPLVLFESGPGVWANAQIAAMMERMETAPFRDAALALMSQ